MQFHPFHHPVRQALAIAVALALLPEVSAAQNPPPPPAATEDTATTIDTLVVSGTARFRGLRKRDASFSITTASPEVIMETAPTSTADLLKIVPGVWSEASGGGGGGANIFVRGMPSEGDAPFFTLQLDGSPIFPPPTLSFLENAGLFRIDDTIARVEGLRGGPSTVYSNGQPGVTVNFIQKQGEDIPDGSVRLTLGSDAMRRVDVYSGGPLGQGSGWYYSIGGFYRDTDGVRDTGFPAEKGGQLSATLSKRWDDNAFTVYARHTDDSNVFYTAVPLISRDNGKHLSSYPGIDATTGTLIGPDFRRVTLPTGNGTETMTRDLANGRGVDINVFGGALDVTVGNWTVSDRFNYLKGDAPTNGLFTGANPQTLASFITDNYGAGASGSGTFVNGDGAVAPDQQVLTAGWWVVDKHLRSFTNDLRFSVDVAPGNTFTIGSYYADYASKDNWWLGNNMLLSVENHARRINLALDDGRIATRDGFVGTANFNLRGDYRGENLAFFIADEWNVTDRIRLDAGVRYERQDIKGTVWDAVSVDLDGDPDTLYDNATSVATTPRRIDQDDNDLSWTAGLNYTLNDTASVFARINSGVAFPQFDSLRDGVTHTTDVDQYELGLKAGSASYELYLTAFYNDFTGLRYQVFTGSGENIVLIGDSSARGLEFEGAWRPLEGFELAWNSTWLRARYGDFASFKGNQVVRQPKFRARLTPSYSWFTSFGDVKVFATYTHVGDRYQDPANGQLLAAYDTWDIGASAHVGEHWEFNLSARNLTDEIALTEGNARVIGGATSGAGVFMGRPLEGRSWLFSAAYRW